ncbi:cytochrome b/b6 domain-containing protein [Ruegeria sp. WL0004]|uniref:Cytochrome b/b6 domain-containing protein n=1 Tax=Ruegeria marisflavi TaxID=2984152 RepID=A0ABT2WQY4_9RHOB|nr:cytochrome b/b6 domain-containing protein [Ruegeria sp. WL0004]MCU9838325.1 cytochrome b/b6 domain-containing protein [Ruegeria sp. WL0004]
MSPRAAYSRLQIALHWLIAVLIAATWLTHENMGRALKARIETGASGFEGNTPHVWLGITVFVLVLIRIVVRRVKGAPGPLPGATPLMEKAALWGHRLLYLLMVLTPALGAVAWNAPSRTVGEIHETVGGALMLVALAHALVALWHQYVKKDGSLTRITRPQG